MYLPQELLRGDLDRRRRPVADLCHSRSSTRSATSALKKDGLEVDELGALASARLILPTCGGRLTALDGRPKLLLTPLLADPGP